MSGLPAVADVHAPGSSAGLGEAAKRYARLMLSKSAHMQATYLSKLMGHADISTTAAYLHQSATDLDAAVLAQHPARATLAAEAERRRQRAWARSRRGS